MSLSIENITFIVAMLSILFSAFGYFKNPQIKADKKQALFEEKLLNIEKEVKEIKETHLKSVETNISDLNQNVSKLALAVNTLSTIIDERVPRKTS